MVSPGDSSGSAAKRVAPAGSDALHQLERGELTLEQYLEDRVERALGAIPIPLSDAQRETVREVLRSQLATDPVFVEYARLTTATPRSDAR